MNLTYEKLSIDCKLFCKLDVRRKLIVLFRNLQQPLIGNLERFHVVSSDVAQIMGDESISSSAESSCRDGSSLT